jgi:hypothetical protein
MQEVPSNQKREDDPMETVRYFALSLHPAMMIMSNPQKIVAVAWVNPSNISEARSQLKIKDICGMGRLLWI